MKDELTDSTSISLARSKRFVDPDPELQVRHRRTRGRAMVRGKRCLNGAETSRMRSAALTGAMLLRGAARLEIQPSTTELRGTN